MIAKLSEHILSVRIIRKHYKSTKVNTEYCIKTRREKYTVYFEMNQNRLMAGQKKRANKCAINKHNKKDMGWVGSCVVIWLSLARQGFFFLGAGVEGRASVCWSSTVALSVCALTFEC